jgi:hypothetical protein
MHMKTKHIENVIAHLGAALIQRAACDDEIIMGHIQDAYEAAKKALIVIEGRRHYHVCGTTAGLHIDTCAVCGNDLRNTAHIAALSPSPHVAPSEASDG